LPSSKGEPDHTSEIEARRVRIGITKNRLEILIDHDAIFPSLSSTYGSVRVTCYSAHNTVSLRSNLVDGTYENGNFGFGLFDSDGRNVHYNYFASRHTLITVQVSPRPLAKTWWSAARVPLRHSERFVRVFQNGVELTNQCEHEVNSNGSQVESGS
jgi:hypothetical protein